MNQPNDPRFVSHIGHGPQVGIQPGMVADAKTWMFTFLADPKKTQAFVDRFLNAPARGEVEFRVLGSSVLGSPVFISFLDSDKLYSTKRPDLGSASDQECSCWIPLVYREKGCLWDTWEWGFWMPYVFVDSSVAMITGREQWGYPKETGRIHIPTSETPDEWGADVMLFSTLSADTKGEQARLLTVTRQPDDQVAEITDIDSIGRTFSEGLTHALGFFPIFGVTNEKDPKRMELWVPLIQLLGHGFRVPVINLKQCRDVTDGRRACLQSIVRNTCTIKKLDKMAFICGSFQLEVTSCESHPILKDLGLEGRSMQALSAIRTEMSFSVDVGEILWKAK